MPQTIIGANGEDQRLTLTLRRWLADNLEDMFFGHNPVFKKLQMLKQVQKGGLGVKLVVPVKYPAAGGPTAAGVSDPYAPVSHSAQTGITSSLWDVAEYLMPISVPDRELKLQGNLTKKLGYLESVMEISMDKYMDVFRQHIWAAEHDANSIGSPTQLSSLRTLFNKGGTASTSPYQPKVRPAQLSADVNSIGWTSAAHGVAAAESAQTANYTVGGINRNAAEKAYFNTPVFNPSSAVALGKDVINKVVTAGTRGTDKPDLIVLSEDHYNTALGILQAQRQITDSKLVEFGFTAFTWRGCDVVFDDDCPLVAPGVNMFAINTKALKFICDTMEPDVKKSEDSERAIQVWKAQWYGQLVMTMMGRGAGARHANLIA